MAQQALFAALASGAALIGLGFLLYAGFAALRPVLGASGAAATIGMGLLLVALMLGLIGRLLARQPAAPELAIAPPAPTGPPTPADLRSMGAFTAAFVVGRLLANATRA